MEENRVLAQSTAGLAEENLLISRSTAVATETTLAAAQSSAIVVQNTHAYVEEIHKHIIYSSAPPIVEFPALTCPTPSECFTGREKDLQTLLDSLSRVGRQIVALIAKGGTGKTQTAMEYVRRFKCR